MYLIKRYLFHFWRLICFFELWIFISSWVRERQRDCHVSCVWSGVDSGRTGSFSGRFKRETFSEFETFYLFPSSFSPFLPLFISVSIHPSYFLLSLQLHFSFLRPILPTIILFFPSSLSVSCLLTRLLCPNPKLTRELFCLAAPPPPPLNLPALFLNLYHFLSSIFV